VASEPGVALSAFDELAFIRREPAVWESRMTPFLSPLLNPYGYLTGSAFDYSPP